VLDEWFTVDVLADVVDLTRAQDMVIGETITTFNVQFNNKAKIASEKYS
jgi:hypothetical protein